MKNTKKVVQEKEAAKAVISRHSCDQQLALFLLVFLYTIFYLQMKWWCNHVINNEYRSEND